MVRRLRRCGTGQMASSMLERSRGLFWSLPRVSLLLFALFLPSFTCSLPTCSSGLAQIAKVLRQRLLAKLAAEKVSEQQEERAEIEAPPPPAPAAEDIADIVEQGLAQSPRSLVAHMLAASFFYEQKEWEAVLQVAEAGLTVLKGIEAEAGKALPR